MSDWPNSIYMDGYEYGCDMTPQQWVDWCEQQEREQYEAWLLQKQIEEEQWTSKPKPPSN